MCKNSQSCIISIADFVQMHQSQLLEWLHQSSQPLLQANQLSLPLYLLLLL